MKSFIYQDIKKQFNESPLNFPGTTTLAEKRCRVVFNNLKHSLNDDSFKFDQSTWCGNQDRSLVSKLRDLQHPIRVSIHTMMVSVIFTLLSLKFRLGIPIEMDWRSGSSPEQIHRLSKSQKPYHFLFTADAGVSYAHASTLLDYSRFFTCFEEVQYIIGRKEAMNNLAMVFITPGITQQTQYELWSKEGRLPREKTELGSISDTPNVAENISSKEALILTCQKSRRFIKEYSFSVIGEEKRGLSFSMYCHNSWVEQPFQLQQFINVFLTEWSFCRTAILNEKLAEFGLQRALHEMWNSHTFLNTYSIASDFELLHGRQFDLS